MKFVIAALVIALGATPAHSQGKGRGPRDEAKTDPKAGAKKKADEEAYQRALKTIPEPRPKSIHGKDRARRAHEPGKLLCKAVDASS